MAKEKKASSSSKSVKVAAKETTERAARKYDPKKGTGSYALIIALYNHFNVSDEAISKSDLMEAAQELWFVHKYIQSTYLPYTNIRFF